MTSLARLEGQLVQYIDDQFNASSSEHLPALGGHHLGAVFGDVVDALELELAGVVHGGEEIGLGNRVDRQLRGHVVAGQVSQ